MDTNTEDRSGRINKCMCIIEHINSCSHWAGIGQAMGAEGLVVDRLEDINTAMNKAIDLQMNQGKTTIVEIMCTRELGDPFHRDALSTPVRFLEKYKDYV